MPLAFRGFEMSLFKRLQGRRLRSIQWRGPNFDSGAASSSGHARMPGFNFRSLSSSTLAQAGKTKSTQWRTILDVGLGLGSGFLGYSLATWNAKPSSLRDNGSADQKPQYGSPEDFEKAIADLKAVPLDGAVSTDPDVLYAHGFSVNDYHPGTYLSTSVTVHFQF